MNSKPENKEMSLNTVINNHCEFWKRENNFAVVQKIPFDKWRKKPYPVVWGEINSPKQINPFDIDAHRFLGLNLPVPELNYGYKMNCIMPMYPQSWMSGIIGCPIFASSVSCTAQGISVSDIEKQMSDFSIKNALDSEWYRFLQKTIDVALQKAGNKIAVSQFHYRGIVDMLAAYLKEDVLCLAIYDYPEQLQALAEKFSELYIAVAKWDMQKRRFWKDGNVTSWGIYAPGELLSYQADASNLFSPIMYEEHFLKFDRKIIKEFEYSLMHTHYAGLHIIDSLIKIEELNAIQISLDREAVSYWKIEYVIEKCKKIQAADKCILINGELSKKELKKLIENLDPNGLMIFYWPPENQNSMIRK